MSGFKTIIFDCDSTLTTIEGIEELAHQHRAEITRLTELAMRGAVPLEEVYGRRLELIRPSRADVEALGVAYVRHLVPGVPDLVRTLHAEHFTVQVLSGGLAPAVGALARHLGVADARIAAVDVYFTEDGSYRGFDADSPLAQAGGKRRWVEGPGAVLPRPILLVGDGATDLEARPAVDGFAAFIGVVHRLEVSSRADVVIEGPSLAPVLELARHGF
jgi:phosphoserine phosphatase